jgi:hypothetical protein
MDFFFLHVFCLKKIFQWLNRRQSACKIEKIITKNLPIFEGPEQSDAKLVYYILRGRAYQSVIPLTLEKVSPFNF